MYNQLNYPPFYNGSYYPYRSCENLVARKAVVPIAGWRLWLKNLKKAHTK